MRSAWTIAIRLEYIASMPDVLKSVPDVEDEEEITRLLCGAVSDAVKRHDEMRRTEGEKLSEDILMRGGMIAGLVKEIEARSPETVNEYAEKLKARITEMIGGSIVATEERILLEAAVFADKVNVTEETVRLASHIQQLESIITNSSQPDGKKLDFLVQEMNREANTIGSKANDLEITQPRACDKERDRKDTRAGSEYRVRDIFTRGEKNAKGQIICDLRSFSCRQGHHRK